MAGLAHMLSWWQSWGLTLGLFSSHHEVSEQGKGRSGGATDSPAHPSVLAMRLEESLLINSGEPLGYGFPRFTLHLPLPG